MPSHPRHASRLPPESFGGRYSVLDQLGRGGMAVVYRVHDRTRDQPVALKQLLVPREARHYVEACACFEREFHTLTELSHPRIIQVYDYGFDSGGPFYTMELLDGGDLIQRSPLCWRDACRLLHDVCSSLALLHSRRLVHCDVTPRNVRCTTGGQAKLIDFGAMTPMGRAKFLIGTPSFVAPETVARSELSGASDLFSLGATLYFALTGHAPYAARTFDELLVAWQRPPRPPSHFASDIPPALEQLVLSSLSLEVSGRPRSAFEIMQRLAAIAGLERAEGAATGAAYLASPRLVGREHLLAAVHEHIRLGLAGAPRAVIVRGPPGAGRSRVLDACALEAKLRGATLLRAAAAGERDFAVAKLLVEQLLESQPALTTSAVARSGLAALCEVGAEPAERLELRDLTDPALERAPLQEVLLRFLSAASAGQPIAIAIDDVHLADAPSVGLLAQWVATANENADLRLCLLLTQSTSGESPHMTELAMLSRQAHVYDLEPLRESETIALVSSLFGEVPHVNVVGAGIHTVAGGNPKLCLDLARHLVATRCVHYSGGAWTLPNRLGPTDLPASADAALRTRVAGLSPLARQLLEAQVLASHEAFTRSDYALSSPSASAQAIDRAVLELLSCELLTANGGVYRLAHRSWAHVLSAHMSEEEKRARHAALAAVYAGEIQSVFHLFAAGLEERGLELLLKLFRARGDAIDTFATLHITAWELGRLFERALAASERLQTSPRDAYDILRWLVAFGAVSDDVYYKRAAPRLLPLLRRASGLDDWDRLSHLTEPGTRLGQALQQAFERYQATPESERICPPNEAIRHLATFVATSIPVGARTSDLPLLESLGPLLEPLVPLSPAVTVIYENAVATCEQVVFGRLERARELWLKIYARFDEDGGKQLQFIEVIRDAIAAAIASLEVQLGYPSAIQWAERIASSSFQLVQSLELRKVLAVQRGDLEAARQFRERAEHALLHSRGRPMFANLPLIELETYATAEDLMLIKQVMERLEVAANRHPPLRAARLLAEAIYKRVCGQLEAACIGFEECLRVCEPDPADPTRPVQVWPIAAGLHLQTLIDLGRAEEARSRGRATLARCEERGIADSAHGVVRGLALAHAACGDTAVAAELLDARIAQQRSRGICGLVLGATYEARARVAIWAGDETNFAEYSRLVAFEYRHGQGSALGARCERLAHEARAGFSSSAAAAAGNTIAASAAPETLVETKRG